MNSKPAKSINMRFVLMALVVIACIQGCTNSKLIISPLYNRLDDQMRDEFNKLGEFNDQQRAAFEARLGTYHVWHRQSELPQYATLIRAVAASVASANTTADDVKQWMEIAEVHTQALRECHPVNFSFDLMRTLPDEQLNFIENRFKKQQKKNRDKYANKSKAERVKSRVDNTVKWAGRIGLDFNSKQRALLEDAFVRQVSLRNEYYALSADWNRQFFRLARDQENANFERNMEQHLSKLWNMLETNHTQKWQANRDIWQESALKLLASMTGDQRKTFNSWVSKMANTLDAISQYKPSFKTIDDPSLGCFAQTEI